MRPFIVLFVLPLIACDRPSGPEARERELHYLRCVVPDNLLEWSHVDVPAVENIAIHGDGADRYLGLHLMPGQKKLHGGVRAEISVDYPFQAGDTVRYSWRLMVPPGFRSDAPSNRWWVIGQWHDQPNRSRGESWDAFPSRSPPVLLSIGELDGKLSIMMAYGSKQSQHRGPFVIQPGTWHELAVVIHWSPSEDGRVTFFFDNLDQPAAVIDGPNMHNDFQHYLKIGMYRHPEIQTENWIYVDDMRITTEKPGS